MSTASGLASRVAGLLLAVGMIAVIAGIGVGVLTFRMYNVLSDSMTPGIVPDDRIVSDSRPAGGQDVRRGDVVMLGRDAWPDSPERADLVKRVVAIGGDTVSFDLGDGRLRINDTLIDEDYLPEGVQPAYEDFSVAVPAEHVFVLGDNRIASTDSLDHMDGGANGTVPNSAILGRVVAVAYPIDRAGMLPQTSAFAEFDPPREAPASLKAAIWLVVAGAGLLLAAGVASLGARLRGQ